MKTATAHGHIRNRRVHLREDERMAVELSILALSAILELDKAEGVREDDVYKAHSRISRIYASVAGRAW